jgi:hypothetical protein
MNTEEMKKWLMSITDFKEEKDKFGRIICLRAYLGLFEKIDPCKNELHYFLFPYNTPEECFLFWTTLRITALEIGCWIEYDVEDKVKVYLCKENEK